MIFSVTFMIYILDIYNPAMFVVYGGPIFLFCLGPANSQGRPAPAAGLYSAVGRDSNNGGVAPMNCIYQLT